MISDFTPFSVGHGDLFCYFLADTCGLFPIAGGQKKTIRIGHFSTDTCVVANVNQLFRRTFDIANKTNLTLDVEMVALPSGVHGIERLLSETLDISWMGNTVLSYGLSRGANLKVIYGQMQWVSIKM